MDFAKFLLQVGENLRRARWAAGLTQEQAAAGRVTYRYYQEIERGQRNPTLQTLFTLAHAFDATVASIVNVEPAATARAAETMASYGLGPPARGRKPKRVAEPKARGSNPKRPRAKRPGRR